jgi:hypothetical protein
MDKSAGCRRAPSRRLYAVPNSNGLQLVQSCAIGDKQVQEPVVVVVQPAESAQLTSRIVDFSQAPQTVMPVIPDATPISRNKIWDREVGALRSAALWLGFRATIRSRSAQNNKSAKTAARILMVDSAFIT